MGSYYRDFYAPKATQQPTIGDTKFSVIHHDHMGWMNCDGRLLSTADYELLFRVIGYSFGGSNNQFKLPDMRSHVPGAVGQGTDGSGNPLTNRLLGDNVGRETHTLVIAEMPSHNHGTDASNTVVGNGLTGVSGEHIHTGIALLNGEHIHTGVADLSGSHTHGITDLGHTHSYFNQPNSHEVAVSLTTTGTADNVNVGQTTSSSQTGISINTDGLHGHTLTIDPSGNHEHVLQIDPSGNHQHTIQTQGGDLPHNNMQPTLFIGHMFIYSGKLHSGTSKWRYANDTNIL